MTVHSPNELSTSLHTCRKIFIFYIYSEYLIKQKSASFRFCTLANLLLFAIVKSLFHKLLDLVLGFSVKISTTKISTYQKYHLTKISTTKIKSHWHYPIERRHRDFKFQLTFHHMKAHGHQKLIFWSLIFCVHILTRHCFWPSLYDCRDKSNPMILYCKFQRALSDILCLLVLKKLQGRRTIASPTHPTSDAPAYNKRLKMIFTLKSKQTIFKVVMVLLSKRKFFAEGATLQCFLGGMVQPLRLLHTKAITVHSRPRSPFELTKKYPQIITQRGTKNLQVVVVLKLFLKTTNVKYRLGIQIKNYL